MVAAAVLLPSVAILHAMDSSTTNTSTAHDDDNHQDHDTNHTGDHDDNETSDDTGTVHADNEDVNDNETETD